MDGTRLAAFRQTVKQFAERVRKNQIKLPSFVKIVELSPRDGLQNEKMILPTAQKIELIDRLSATGLRTVECTSFVSPKWVPQMADHNEVYRGITKFSGVTYPVLVPNLKGFESALSAGVKEIAVFGAASETFTQKNINCSIKESLEKFRSVCEAAKKNNVLIRGYISTVMGCPYEGEVRAEKVAQVARSLFELGCYEVSLGDTTGVGTPEKTQKLFDALKTEFGNTPESQKFAAHFHDTYDRALSNLFVALENGISVIDSSVGGLGGCPYAKTQAGNVCTENVVFALHELGIQTGVDVQRLREVGKWITGILQRENMSIL